MKKRKVYPKELRARVALEAIKEAKRKYINTRREKERLGVDNVDRSRHNAEAYTEAEAEKSKTKADRKGKISTTE